MPSSKLFWAVPPSSCPRNDLINHNHLEYSEWANDCHVMIHSNCLCWLGIGFIFKFVILVNYTTLSVLSYRDMIGIQLFTILSICTNKQWNLGIIKLVDKERIFGFWNLYFTVQKMGLVTFWLCTDGDVHIWAIILLCGSCQSFICPVHTEA